MRLHLNHSCGRDIGNSPLHQAFWLRTFFSALAMLFFSVEVHAQPQKPRPTPVSSNRYLFVIDTSASVKSHVDDITKVVNEIILSGASGQLHPGDSIGVWTFNEEVYSDLPMQAWVPTDREQIAKNTTDFLKKQHFHKGSHLERALPDMMSLVKNSDIITIFIISDGSGKMSGTPFDQDINSTYVQTVKDMKGRRKPVVTVLQSKGGKLIQYTINAVPWPVVIPELPIQVIAPQALAPETKTNYAQPPPMPTMPTAPTAPRTPPVLPSTPHPIATPPAPPVPTTSTAPNNSVPVPPIQPQNISPAANVPPAVVTQPAPAVLPVQQPNNVASTSPQTPVVPSQPGQPPNAQPFIPRFPPPTAAAPAASRGLPTPPAFNPMNLPGAPHPAPRLPVPPPIVPESANASTTNAKTPALASTNTFGARALAFISPNLTGRSNSYLVAGVILILIAISLILLMVRRARSSSGPSFITQSINNEKK